MTQQQPQLIIGDQPVTDHEETSALLALLNSNEEFKIKFTTEVLGIRTTVQQAEIEAQKAKIEALQAELSGRGSNGTGDVGQTEEKVASPHVEGTQEEGRQEGA
jgi:hypothetical protein|tara:strand:+ start:4800 stop:5111 length:312 start_codon:yes stop_codon:yes gene_type:complete